MDKIDVPLLLAGCQPAHPHHASAVAALNRLRTASEPWELPLPAVMSFLRTVTSSPWNMRSIDAVDFVHTLVSAPGCHFQVPYQTVADAPVCPPNAPLRQVQA